VFKNKNRGYQQLRVWHDAVQFYGLNARVFGRFPDMLRRVASQAIGSSDSIHRNIAEGYCRRSLREYLNFLNIALGSLGESVSGLEAYRRAGQISDADFTQLNELAFKLENGLLRLVQSLERKQMTGDWIDKLIVKETNDLYGSSNEFDSNSPVLHHSNTP